MSMQSQDIIKRSATNSITPPPQVRDDKFYLYWLQSVPGSLF